MAHHELSFKNRIKIEKQKSIIKSLAYIEETLVNVSLQFGNRNWTGLKRYPTLKPSSVKLVAEEKIVKALKSRFNRNRANAGNFRSFQ